MRCNSLDAIVLGFFLPAIFFFFRFCYSPKRWKEKTFLIRRKTAQNDTKRNFINFDTETGEAQQCCLCEKQKNDCQAAPNTHKGDMEIIRGNDINIEHIRWGSLIGPNGIHSK